jgi:hypothetical protein
MSEPDLRVVVQPLPGDRTPEALPDGKTESGTPGRLGLFFVALLHDQGFGLQPVAKR